MNVKKYLLEQHLLEMQLEALDFKNIEAYSVSDTGEFQSENSKVTISMDEISHEDLDVLIKAKWLKIPGNVFQQNLDFYKRKKLEQSKIYSIGFTVDDIETQAKKTTYREYIRILYTVFMYTKNFVEKKKPFAVVVFSTDKYQNDTRGQKKLVYDYIIKTHIPSEYRAIEGTLRGRPGTIIFRETLPNKK